MTDLSKLAEDLSQNRHNQEFAELQNQVSKFPLHEKQAVLKAVGLVKEAEANNEIPTQTPFGRLNMAVELTKAAAISGNEEFQKEAANAFAAGQLAAVLLDEAIKKQA